MTTRVTGGKHIMEYIKITISILDSRAMTHYVEYTQAEYFYIGLEKEANPMR